MKYHFAIQNNPGKWHCGPDARSQNPTHFWWNRHLKFYHKQELWPSSHTQRDYPCLKFWPTISNTLENYHQQFSLIQKRVGSTNTRILDVRARLSVHNNIALLDQRLVVPKIFWKCTASVFHSAHQGITSMQARPNTTAY